MANLQLKGAENGLMGQVSEDNLVPSILNERDRLTVRELKVIAENWVFAEDDPDMFCVKIDEELGFWI